MHLQEWVTLSFLWATMALISILHHPWKDDFISTWSLSVGEHPTLYSQNQTCKCTPLKHICLSLLIEMSNHSPSYLTSRACTFLLSFPSVSSHLHSATAWAMVFFPIPPFTFLYYFNKFFKSLIISYNVLIIIIPTSFPYLPLDPLLLSYSPNFLSSFYLIIHQIQVVVHVCRSTQSSTQV